MKDKHKTKELLINELRRRITELEKAETKRKQAEEKLRESEQKYQHIWERLLMEVSRDITERKRVEEALKESEEKYRSLVESSKDSIYLVDRNGKYLFMNNEHLSRLGLQMSQVMGRTYGEFHSPEETEEFAKKVKEVLETGKSLWYEYRSERNNRYFIRTLSPVKDSKTHMLTAVTVISKDITKRKKAEEALRKSEQKYRSLINNVKLGIFRSTPGPTGRFLEVNPAMEEITGYSREELLSMNVSDLYVHPEEREAVLEEMAAAVGKATKELNFRKKDGTEIVISDTKVAVRDNTGKILYFDGIIEDITERKRMEEALRESEGKYRSLVESTKDSVYLVDRNCKYLFMNNEHLSRLGLQMDQVMGRTYGEFHSPEETEEFAKKIKEVLEASKSLWYEYRSGSDNRYFIRTLSPVKDSKTRRLTAVTVISKDITERKRVEEALKGYSERLEEMVKQRTKEVKDAQEELVRKERLAILGEFSGSISHELRNPLATIDSSAYYLKIRLKDADEKVQKHLDRIKSSVGTSTAIIESLLSLTRMKEPRLERVDLIAVTSGAITASEVPARVNVIQNFLEQEVLVHADQEQLCVALKNIVNNAVEAMEGKGTLTVTVCRTTGGQAEVAFADTGLGIAPENLDKIFQPLFSTKARGIGFGLSIAKVLIEKHHGTIKAESGLGKGATIVTRLPLYVEGGEEV